MKLEFAYTNLLQYGNVVEIKRFERRPVGGRRSAAVSVGNGVPRLFDDGKDNEGSPKPEKIRTEKNARSAVMAFRRLVASNLTGTSNPLLITLTYRENQEDIDVGRRDFRNFALRATRRFGRGTKYIVVAEFQERGAIHFHALFWGLGESLADTERSTRLVASLWGKGFVDIIKTDGHPKIATYMSGYFKGIFVDPRLKGRKAYIASKNVSRPIYIRDAILAPHYMGLASPDLSTGGIWEEFEYDTQWLGRCLFKKQIIKPEYVQSNSKSS